MIFGLFGAALAASASTRPAGLEQELRRWVQARVGREREGPVGYTPVLVDLNGDRSPEALVYLDGRDWCGSGGCNLYILQRRAGTWRLINSVTIANAPIRLLATRSRGWSDIGVRVRGGGQPGYEAVLRFNGVRYPGNPTVAPAFRAARGAAGRILVSEQTEPKPLFP